MPSRFCLIADAGRASSTFTRYHSLDSSPHFSLESPELFDGMVHRAAELGFTDVITHWPRPESPYAGDVATLVTVATQVIRRLRAL